MSVGASRGDAALAAALAHIDDFVAVALRAGTMPGVSLAITDRDGLVATREYGFANLDAKTPVTAETLFEIGSIGKAFTAALLLQQAEAGALDLHAPVTTYLPWFAVRSQHEPITIHHLLTHTSGLPAGSDFSPDPRVEVWALREVAAAPPGGRARYSNVGYKLLGLVLEAVTRAPYGRLVEERILAPLGMTHATGAIINATRPRLAVGYTDYYNDRPWRPEHGFVPAPWLETNSGDGCLAATAADLAAFLRMLLNGGAGPHGRVLSAASFAQMTAPHATVDEDLAYGYGLDLEVKDGRQRISKGGSMVGFVATMTGDVASGIGVVVFTNAIQDTSDIADFAMRSVVNALAGDPLPDPPAPPAIDLGHYTGAYRDGPSMLFVDADGERLAIVREGERVVLEPLGVPPQPDHFLARQPGLELFPFRFQRAETGRVEALVHGAQWYPAAWYDGPTAFATPAAWSAFPGHYRSYNPWTPGFRVVLRQGALRLIYPWGGESLLRPDGEAFVADDEPEGPERFVFDTIVDGQALRVGSPGSETYYRFFTP